MHDAYAFFIPLPPARRPLLRSSSLRTRYTRTYKRRLCECILLALFSFFYFQLNSTRTYVECILAGAPLKRSTRAVSSCGGFFRSFLFTRSLNRAAMQYRCSCIFFPQIKAWRGATEVASSSRVQRFRCDWNGKKKDVVGKVLVNRITHRISNFNVDVSVEDHVTLEKESVE